MKFSAVVTDFEATTSSELKKNPRICMGLRPSGTDEPYDLVQLSMTNLTEGYWTIYDGMDSNPSTWCGQAVGSDAESDVDWKLAQEKGNFNVFEKTLEANFTRSILGSSKGDYVFELGKKYDIILVYGVWTSEKTTSTRTSQASGVVQTMNQGQILFKKATEESLSLWLFMNASLAILTLLI